MNSLALDREADAGGLNVWTNALRDGSRDGASLAEGFIMSDEFIRRELNDKSYVDVLYMAFLGREGEDPEIASWEKELRNGKNRAGMIETGFGHSQEFKNLLNSYGFVVYE